MNPRICVLAIILSLLLAACGPATTMPAPTVPPSAAAATQPHPTGTPRPTRTAPPTRALLPTWTPRPTWTPTPQPTARPTSSPAPTESPVVEGPFALVPDSPGRPAGTLRSLKVAPDGTLWLATEQGVGSFRDGAWTLHLERDAQLAGIDAAGRVYASLDGDTALAVWDGVGWAFYAAEEGWSAPLRDGLAFGETPVIDARGWVWLAACEDVRSFDGTRWTVHTLEEVGFTSEEPDYRCIRDVALDSTGDVWVGECEEWGAGPSGDGARWFDGRTWQGADSPRVGAGSGCVRDIEVDGAGRIYEGFWRYTPGEGWEHLGEPDKPEEGWRWGVPFELALGPGGELWALLDRCGRASCFNGFYLYHLHDGQWVQAVGEHWSGDLAFGPDGTAWVCADLAVYRVMGTAVERVGGIVAGEGWCDLEVDPAGRVWMAVVGTEALYVYEGP